MHHQRIGWCGEGGRKAHACPQGDGKEEGVGAQSHLGGSTHGDGSHQYGGGCIADEDGKVEYGAYIAMKTAQGNVVPWLPSQTDMLAEDWILVD